MQKKVNIESSKCTGCALCVKDCTDNSLEIRNDKAVVINENCLMCGHCVAICPESAVTIDGYDMSEVIPIEETDTLDDKQLMKVIKGMRSIRHFKEEKIDKEIINAIIDAGRYSSTGSNSQNVRYIVVENDIDKLEAMVLPKLRGIQKLLGVTNKVIKSKLDLSRYSFEEGFLFKNAPLLILVVANSDVDGALASKSMELMARSKGLGNLYVGIFTAIGNRNKKIKSLLGLKGKEKFVTCLALGYPDVKYERTVPRNKADVVWR